MSASLLSHGGIAQAENRDGGNVATLRADAGEKIKSTLLDKTGEDPLIEKLRAGYEALSAISFIGSKKPKWGEVADKLTPDVLGRIKKLDNPKFFGFNKNRELLIGDGSKEVPGYTLGLNYAQARSDAGKDGLSLMNPSEYTGVFGTTPVGSPSWLESGDATPVALRAIWNGDHVKIESVPSRTSYGLGGARRVVRISGF